MRNCDLEFNNKIQLTINSPHYAIVPDVTNLINFDLILYYCLQKSYKGEI